MRHRFPAWALVAGVLVVIAGCAQPDARPTSPETGAVPLPRPNRVLLYDFVIAVAPDVRGADPSAPVEQRLAAGAPAVAEGPIAREVAAQLGDRLVARLRAMGLSAERAAGQAPVAGAVQAPTGSLLIEGQVRADTAPQGPAADAGTAVITGVRTAVQVYSASGGAPRLVDGFVRNTEVGRQSGAGASAPADTVQAVAKVYAERAADEIATQMAEFFASQGWIATGPGR